MDKDVVHMLLRRHRMCNIIFIYKFEGNILWGMVLQTNTFSVPNETRHEDERERKRNGDSQCRFLLENSNIGWAMAWQPLR